VELSPIENNARRSRRNGTQGGRETDRIERREEGWVGRRTSRRGGGGGRAGGAPGGAFYGELRTVSRCVRLQRRA